MKHRYDYFECTSNLVITKAIKDQWLLWIIVQKPSRTSSIKIQWHNWIDLVIGPVMYLVRDNLVRFDRFGVNLATWTGFENSLHIKKNSPKKLKTYVIVLLNYYLWTCVINFNSSIVMLDFGVWIIFSNQIMLVICLYIIDTYIILNFLIYIKLNRMNY